MSLLPGAVYGVCGSDEHPSLCSWAGPLPERGGAARTWGVCQLVPKPTLTAVLCPMPSSAVLLQGDDGPDVRGGSGDILLVHATETDRKGTAALCRARRRRGVPLKPWLCPPPL